MKLGSLGRALVLSSMALSLIGCQAKPQNLVAPGIQGDSARNGDEVSSGGSDSGGSPEWGGSKEGGPTYNGYKGGYDGGGLSEGDDGGGTAPGGLSIDPKKELVITDLSVVNDLVRTTGDGAWTFGTLMKRMAGNHDPSQFTKEWLEHWITEQTVNGHDVEARKAMENFVIKPWLEKSGGQKLDLSKAPFRLLAIVNRADLRHEGTAGENRFVFNLLDPKGKKTFFNAIFEYGVDLRQVEGDFGERHDLTPKRRIQLLLEYEERWHQLASLPYGEEYNAALQQLTDLFSGEGANPTKPNGNGLNQLRTNEIQLGLLNAIDDKGKFHPELAKPWELREFKVGDDGYLDEVSPALTPDPSFNGTARLAEVINSQEAAELKDAATLPPDMGCGSALVPGAFGEPPIVWNAPGITNPEARFHFALNTCNGCHLVEAGLNKPLVPGISFLQIQPRDPDKEAVLSKFMIGPDNVQDPANPALSHDLNDVQRRVKDLMTILSYRYTPNRRITHEMEEPFPGRTD